MAIVTYDGFENYGAFNDVKSLLGWDNYQPATIISGDGTVVARNNLSCLKLVSSRTFGTGSEIGTNREFYPKITIQAPNAATYSSGVIGFAFYARLPSGGGWGPFTPIAALVDQNNKPHFYICVNGNMQIEIRRWNTGATMANRAGVVTAANYVWNQDHVSFGYSVGFYCNEGRTAFDHHVTAPQAAGCNNVNGTWPMAALSTSKFELIGTASALAGNRVIQNQWNYIELNFTIDNAASSNTGILQVKINRDAADATLDLNLSAVRTSTQSTTTFQKVMFGIVWGHDVAGTTSTANLGWSTYIDDFYWLDKTGSSFNTFLGRVSCQKLPYTAVTSNTTVSPLVNVQDTVQGAVTYNTQAFVQFSATNQTFNTSLANTNNLLFNPLVVRQTIHGHKEGGNNLLRMRSTYLGIQSAATNITVSSDSVNGGIHHAEYATAPDGTAWTVEKFKNTTFSHTVVNP
jgi:hypothetical protein